MHPPLASLLVLILLLMGEIFAMDAPKAHAQLRFEERLGGSGELFLAKNLDHPNRDRYGFGVGGSLYGEFLLWQSLGLQLGGTGAWFAEKGPVVDTDGDGVLDQKDDTYFFGLTTGLRFHWSRLLFQHADDGWVDVHFLYGAQEDFKRPGLDAGIGYDFALRRDGGFRVGPFARLNWLSAPGGGSRGAVFRAEAPLWIHVGVSLALGTPSAQARKRADGDDDDEDGVRNGADLCPQTPAGKLPDPKRSGCPIPDRDHDSVPDEDDMCPDDAGIASSRPDINGCPSAVIVEETRLTIVNKRIFFATNEATILEKSFPLLEDIARAIIEASWIPHIVIEGHTDARSTPEYNQTLSVERARSVRDALIRRGVDAKKLSVRGYGETRPIAVNDSEEGRAKNRRVQFYIVELEEIEAPQQMPEQTPGSTMEADDSNGLEEGTPDADTPSTGRRP